MYLHCSLLFQRQLSMRTSVQAGSFNHQLEDYLCDAKNRWTWLYNNMLCGHDDSGSCMHPEAGRLHADPPRLSGRLDWAGVVCCARHAPFLFHFHGPCLDPVPYWGERPRSPRGWQRRPPGVGPAGRRRRRRRLRRPAGPGWPPTRCPRCRTSR